MQLRSFREGSVLRKKVLRFVQIFIVLKICHFFHLLASFCKVWWLEQGPSSILAYAGLNFAVEKTKRINREVKKSKVTRRA